MRRQQKHDTMANCQHSHTKLLHKFCMEVRKTVVDTLKSILGLHEHTRKAKFQLGFYCPGTFKDNGQLHFCGCLPRQNHTNPKMVLCSKSPHCQDKCCLPHECTIWFDYWKVCFCSCFVQLLLFLFIYEHNRTPSGKKSVTGMLVITASQVQSVRCRWQALFVLPITEAHTSRW